MYVGSYMYISICKSDYCVVCCSSLYMIVYVVCSVQVGVCT